MLLSRIVPSLPLGLIVPLALPAIASAAPLDAVAVAEHATLINQLIMAALLAASVAGAVVCGLKLAAGPRQAGGSLFLSGLRFGGPLAGLLGAAWQALRSFIALSNLTTEPSLHALAPGLAECMLLIVLGLFAGAVAVMGNWALEARIDQAVLRP
ncbi:MAG TPA: MotA/TolQ/ExbB proton channel family protein [Caulobacteraceae bacterium]|nr:MotA/TolQ/ExbB proton channel family protein [Caulobacteraceae bacterium]